MVIIVIQMRELADDSLYEVHRQGDVEQGLQHESSFKIGTKNLGYKVFNNNNNNY